MCVCEVPLLMETQHLCPSICALVKRALTGGKLLQPDLEVSFWETPYLQKVTEPISGAGSASCTLAFLKGADSRGCSRSSPRCAVPGDSMSRAGLWHTQGLSLALLAPCAGLESPPCCAPVTPSASRASEARSQPLAGILWAAQLCNTSVINSEVSACLQ